MEAFTFNTAELILLSAAGILFIIQLIYYFGLYNRIHVRNKTVRKEETHFSRELPPLSVILCARNEADNLRKILPAILEQDYPQFEVIVINDASTDETEDVLGYMEEKYPHLYHSFTPDSARYISHKKLALTLGIKASKHDWLVFTETNCMPAMAETYGAQLHFANANRIGVQRIRPYQRLVTQTYRIRYIISVFTLSGVRLGRKPLYGYRS